MKALAVVRELCKCTQCGQVLFAPPEHFRCRSCGCTTHYLACATGLAMVELVKFEHPDECQAFWETNFAMVAKPCEGRAEFNVHLPDGRVKRCCWVHAQAAKVRPLHWNPRFP